MPALWRPGIFESIGAKQSVSPAVWRPRRDNFEGGLDASSFCLTPERHSMRPDGKRKSFLPGGPPRTSKGDCQ